MKPTFKTEELLNQAILRYFGLNESTRSDASYEALSAQICTALNEWANKPGEHMSIRWTFSNRVIASAWNEDDYGVWEIPWSQDDQGNFTFGTPVPVNQIALYEPMTESIKKLDKKRRFEETIDQALQVDKADSNGAMRIRAIGVTADVVNRNGRRYPRKVLAEAIQRLNGHLNESAGQGRLILTGEAEHPGDKGQKEHILETVFRWDAVSLGLDNNVMLEGVIVPTTRGKDLQVLAQHHIPIGISQRAYGESKTLTESGQTIEEVTYLEITGYDGVKRPSDPNATLLSESANDPKGEEKQMTYEEMLAELLKDPKKLAASVKDNAALTESVTAELGLTDRRQIAGQLGINAGRLDAGLKEMQEKAQKFEEAERQKGIDNAIDEACKNLPYGEALNKKFLETVREAKPATVEAVQPLVEGQIKVFDSILAEMKLVNMGRGNIQVLGPVFERETGQPEYTRASYELTESLVKKGFGKRRDLRKAMTPSEIYTRDILELYDRNYKMKLMAESKAWQEAELTTDLALPYTVMRTVIERAFPELVAANVFTFGVATNSPERIFYEAYTGETGYAATVTDEVVTADLDVWVSLLNGRATPGTVLVTNSGATTTYTEGTDYVYDYAAGRFKALTGGAITDGQSLKIDYAYNAIRKGEMAEIERAKLTLTSMILDIAADRLATQISSEAIVFSRSQLGYDAVGRTLNNLIREVRRIIDTGIFYLAISASLQQANNSGGTWASASDPIVQLVEKMGISKTKVYNRFYVPTAFVMSQTNADRLSNWDGFTRLGFPDAVLNSAGFAGSVKGLPIYATPEMSDRYVLSVNNELVIHRVYQAMQLKGPFPSYSNGKLVAAEQWYVEEYNGDAVPVPEKASHVIVT